MNLKAKQFGSALALSVSGFLSILVSEGFSDTAYVPVKGDVVTIGFGSTVDESGKPIKAGTQITPQRALYMAKVHMDKDEVQFRKTLKDVKLSQAEYDIYFDFTYQYGIGTWSKSSMLKALRSSDYTKACESLKLYKIVAGRDCSVRSNGCYGVWTRSLQRYEDCMAAQETV